MHRREKLKRRLEEAARILGLDADETDIGLDRNDDGGWQIKSRNGVRLRQELIPERHWVSRSGFEVLASIRGKR